VGKLVRFRQSDDETLAFTARLRRCYFEQPLNYFISYYDRSAATGGAGLTGKSGRKTANVCDASIREMNINTAVNFPLVAFIKINRLSSFFSEICQAKFSNQDRML
jgi:hypothetical protein